MALHFSEDKLINLNKTLETLESNKVLKVGWVNKTRYEDGNYIAEIAAQNEYGAPHKHIPARPFMAPAVANNKNEWVDTIKSGLKRVVKGEMALTDLLEDLGQEASGDVGKAITEVTSPPLSPITIQIRLSKYKNKKLVGSLTKPLIDTGIMLRSVTYAIEDE